MGTKRGSTLTSKWIKTNVLMKSAKISPLIPETVRFGRESLKQMLDKYGMVYIKPERGTHGNGVMRAETVRESGKTSYQCQNGTKIQKMQEFESFYRSLKKRTGSRSYLIQKGIPLLKHKDRRFDLRVMVQISPEGKWETTGLIGRVAEPGKIVTNYHNGGKPMAIEKLLSSHMDASRQAQLIKQLKKLGEDIGKFYHKKNLAFKQIGVDVGLDRKLTPWIIEVNTSPDPYIFNQLKDKSMYRKVMAYRRTILKQKKA
ncbi:YheC/YheD family protein [Paenibacillus sp. M1]|uniref:YheC/YheD family protein n=1 Tax=Paenibacillus haidiansis TaxID=1574488 RepID=A0ABU7VWU7_9BACL